MHSIVEALIPVLDDIELARQHGELTGPFARSRRSSRGSWRVRRGAVRRGRGGVRPGGARGAHALARRGRHGRPCSWCCSPGTGRRQGDPGGPRGRGRTGVDIAVSVEVPRVTSSTRTHEIEGRSGDDRSGLAREGLLRRARRAQGRRRRRHQEGLPQARAPAPPRPQPGGRQAAEARFKEIGEAYAVLSDPEQRRQYDPLRAMARRRPLPAGGAAAAGFEDLFGGMFGGGQPRAGASGTPHAARRRRPVSTTCSARCSAAGGRPAVPARAPAADPGATHARHAAVPAGGRRPTVSLMSTAARSRPASRRASTTARRSACAARAGPASTAAPPGDLVVTVPSRRTRSSRSTATTCASPCPSRSPRRRSAPRSRCRRSTGRPSAAEGARGHAVGPGRCASRARACPRRQGRPAGHRAGRRPAEAEDDAREALQAFGTATSGEDVRATCSTPAKK